MPSRSQRQEEFHAELQVIDLNLAAVAGRMYKAA
jgi:hypothetical protein